MNRPCVRCGELTAVSPCRDCHAEDERERHARQPRREHYAPGMNSTRWKNLSKRLRKMSPFCERCGATDDLTCDHIIPIEEAPELTYIIENLRVLCRSCNSKRKDAVTDAERAEVLQRIAEAKTRRARRLLAYNNPGGMTPDATVHRRRRWGQPRLQSMEIARQGDI